MNAVLPDPFADSALGAAALLLLKVTLLLALAFAATALLRRQSAAIRHDLWSLAMLAALALALVAPLAPPIELRWLPAEGAPAGGRENAVADIGAASPVAGVAPAVAPLAAPPLAAPPSAAPAEPAAVAPPPTARPKGATPTPQRLPAPRLATLFWLLGAAAVLARSGLGHLGLRRLVARAELLGADWQALLADTSAAAGVRRPIRLRASAAVATPLTWGAWRPTVVLPADAETWPLERRRAALLHELAHVARLDYLAQLLATVTCALYWFHPLAWMALRGLRREAERACDDRVLALGAAPAEYAAQLLEVARGASAARLGSFVTAIGMARPSTIEGRLLAVLDERLSRATTPRRARLLSAAALAAVLVPFAALTPVAAASVTTAEPVLASHAEPELGGEPSLADEPALPVEPASAGAPALPGGSALAGEPAPTAEPVVATNLAEPSPGTVAVLAMNDLPTSVDLRPLLAASEPSAGQVADSPRIRRSEPASLGEELRLDLETGAGVTITGWDESRVEVESHLGGRDWRDTRVAVDRVAGGVSVHLWFEPEHGSQSTSHHLTIRVPRRFDVRLQSAGGDLSIAGVEGNFRGSTGGGSIRLRNLRGAAKLSTGGGEVRVSDSHLSGTVTTGGGGVRLSNITGGLRGSSGSGPVVYREGEGDDGEEAAIGELGDVDIDVNPDFDIDFDIDPDPDFDVDSDVDSRHGKSEPRGTDDRAPRGTGRLHVSKAGGDVRLGSAPEGADISTGGGDVVVGRSAGLVDASTGGGNIEIGPVAGSVRATTGAGRVEVTLVDADGAAQNVEVSSGTGKVVIVLPRGFGGTLDLETAYTNTFGRATRISTPWKLQQETTGWESRHGTPRRFVRAKGTAGSGGGGVVRVRTVNGDVEVREGS